ncbi:RidA family protein [Marinigracilibium pacificum]|uniref:RidA family protein n=1 Tax=Marinigracilibium pacificum TaxID=2729599 RepID=A0A848IZP3_9BACT|nr:RidA family protein [Marinigracilibium pacificum]NMM48851.1 RidA family protein [Marinigracilibium pacificum]
METIKKHSDNILSAPDAIITENFLFCSAQLPIIHSSKSLSGTDIDSQALQVMLNLREVLELKQLNFVDLVKTTIFVTDISEISKIKRIYESFFKIQQPVCSVIEVSKLPMDAKIAIEAIAKL